NLLVGRFEPVAHRRRRARVRLAAAAALVVIAALVTVGFVRRANFWNTVAAGAHERIQQTLRSLGPGAPDQTHLSVELTNFKQVSDTMARVQPAPDAAVALSALLRAWPSAAPARVQSITVSESGSTVSVATERDPAPFLASFKPPFGWMMDEP